MICPTWAEFDAAVLEIARRVPQVRGVFGVPRGGLCLAVALSHRLGVPLSHPGAGVLVVDDVVETGLTFERYPPELFWAWFNKSTLAVNAVTVAPSDAWIVFPWEARENAGADEESYRAARQ